MEKGTQHASNDKHNPLQTDPFVTGEIGRKRLNFAFLQCAPWANTLHEINQKPKSRGGQKVEKWIAKWGRVQFFKDVSDNKSFIRASHRKMPHELKNSAIDAEAVEHVSCLLKKNPSLIFSNVVLIKSLEVGNSFSVSLPKCNETVMFVVESTLHLDGDYYYQFGRFGGHGTLRMKQSDGELTDI
ncbi:hypothetical protein AKO1_005201 [Acrasis kona]|uniref:Uncharacterized protein n=1 Tax=Acrasis kona TaxID=1008807 RepID=A0AAW2YGX4_9EUKA